MGILTVTNNSTSIYPGLWNDETEAWWKRVQRWWRKRSLGLLPHRPLWEQDINLVLASADVWRLGQ